MRIALVQANSVPGDFDVSVARMLECARQADAWGCDLIVFPASLLGGVYPGGLVRSISYQLDLLDAIDRYARETPVASLVPAYVNDGPIGYTEVFLCDEGCAGPLRLREANGADMVGEPPESLDAMACIAGVDIHVLVDGAMPWAATSGVDVVVACPITPFCDDDVSTLLAPALGETLPAMAVDEGRRWLAVVQGVGAYDDAVLAGGSYVLSPEGEVVAACPSFAEGMACFDVPDPHPAGADVRARPAATGCGSPLVGLRAGQVPVLTAEQRTGMLWQALVLAVRDYVRKSGFEGVIVGLSGGLDSSVVAALAVDALGADNVLGVLMPGPYSSESSVTDAEALADCLGIRRVSSPITPLYALAREEIAQAAGVPIEGLAQENLQARLRGLTLMTLSNALGMLVLNTSNKSEAGMGYSTLYGDTVGAYAPLADVYKGRVFELARWRNTQGPELVIPENVLAKPPSAELSPGQTDEASFGVEYPVIDKALYMHVDRGLDLDDLVLRGVDGASAKRVLDACRIAEYKRRQEPMGPVVSLAPLIDRGWPVVLGWRDHFTARDMSALMDEEGLPLDDPETRRSMAVGQRLDDMLANFAHQDQVISMATDVAFSASISGGGIDLDDCMGLPMFSKN